MRRSEKLVLYTSKVHCETVEVEDGIICCTRASGGDLKRIHKAVVRDVRLVQAVSPFEEHLVA